MTIYSKRLLCSLSQLKRLQCSYLLAFSISDLLQAYLSLAYLILCKLDRLRLDLLKVTILVQRWLNLPWENQLIAIISPLFHLYKSMPTASMRHSIKLWPTCYIVMPHLTAIATAILPSTSCYLVL